MPADKSRKIKQVYLPGGKVIEVVTFSELEPTSTTSPVADASALHAVAANTSVQLHVCPSCAGDLVYPIDWSESGPSHWDVSRRCPECEWSDTSTFDQDQVERFDAELDRGAEVLLNDLQQLANANMAEDVERFIRALNADFILPSDF